MRKAIAVIALLGTVGCVSDADKASDNISRAAEQFEVQRHIIGINGITDEVLFEVEGRCSIESDVEDKQLEVTCKHGPDSYKKHFIGISDNVTYVAAQTEPIDADVYRTRIIIKPENVIPNFDLVTG